MVRSSEYSQWGALRAFPVQDCAAGSAQRQAQVATTAAAAVARAQPRGGGGGKGGGVPPAQVGAQAQAWVEGDASAHPRSASKLAAKQHIDAVIARCGLRHVGAGWHPFSAKQGLGGERRLRPLCARLVALDPDFGHGRPAPLACAANCSAPVPGLRRGGRSGSGRMQWSVPRTQTRLPLALPYWAWVLLRCTGEWGGKVGDKGGPLKVSPGVWVLVCWRDTVLVRREGGGMGHIISMGACL